MTTSETRNGGPFEPEFSKAASSKPVRSDPEEARLWPQGPLSHGSESLALLSSTALRACLGCLALSLFWLGLMLLGSWHHLGGRYDALPDPAALQGTCNLNRSNLVIASATDSSQLSGWLDGFEAANWDLAVIFSGSQDLECAQCVHIEQAQGGKWQMVLQFLTNPAFEQCYGPHYKQVYIPDDDMALTAASISLLFDFQSHFVLDLVHPLLCSPSSPCTPGSFMVQQPASALKHVGWVDVTVPTFSMDFLLRSVVPTLQHDQPGNDSIWRLKLGQDSIAVDDQICQVSLLGNGPLWALPEDHGLFSTSTSKICFSYTTSRLGEPHQPIQVSVAMVRPLGQLAQGQLQSIVPVNCCIDGFSITCYHGMRCSRCSGAYPYVGYSNPLRRCGTSPAFHVQCSLPLMGPMQTAKAFLDQQTLTFLADSSTAGLLQQQATMLQTVASRTPA